MSNLMNHAAWCVGAVGLFVPMARAQVFLTNAPFPPPIAAIEFNPGGSLIRGGAVRCQFGALNKGPTTVVIDARLELFLGTISFETYNTPEMLTFTLKPNEFQSFDLTQVSRWRADMPEDGSFIARMSWSDRSGADGSGLTFFTGKIARGFRVTPVNEPADHRGDSKPFTIDFLVENLGDSAITSRTLHFLTNGPIEPIPPVTVQVAFRQSTLLPITVTPTPGVNSGPPVFARLSILYRDLGATPQTYSGALVLLGAKPIDPDLNGDGVVDGSDLAILVNNWGAAP